VKLLKVPYRLMFVGIVIFCCIGVYSINSEPADILIMGALAVFGYGLTKFGFEPAPLTLGFVLGRMMEENLRQALMISRGNLMTFVERPIAAILIVIALAMLTVAVLPAIRKGRDEVFSE
jgi:putative tricarboxylic transport membrane protein